MHMAMPSTSAASSSDDLVAFSGPSTSQYSYAPPAPGSSVASPIMSTDVLNTSNGSEAVVAPSRKSMATSEGYGRRNVTRQASYTYAMQSVGSLPMYSPREPGGAAFAGVHARRSGSHDEENDNEDDSADEDSEEDDDEDDGDNELEMDTLNKNSQGRGGWKMLGSSEADGRHSHSVPSSPRSSHSPTSPTSTKRKRVPSNESSLGNTAKQSKQKQGNFERFEVKEWLSMAVSFLLVTALTVIALHICFSG